MKILTFNVLNKWGTKTADIRDELTLDLLAKEKPVIFGFQEFDDRYRDDGRIIEGIKELGYAEVLPELRSWNAIFYNPEKLRLISGGEEDFTDGTVYNHYPVNTYSRFRTILHGLFESDAGRFIFVSTHYDYNREREITERNQESEAKQLIARVKELSRLNGAPAIVVGDYNSHIDEMAAKAMLEAGFADTHTLASEKDDTASCAKDISLPVEGDYTRAIDHVFVLGEFTVGEYRTILNYRDASDHCPVVAEINLK